MRHPSHLGPGLLVAALAVLAVAGCQRSGEPQAPPGSGTNPGLRDTARAPEVSAEDASNVLRAYYRAISEGRYREAYESWASNGAASGKSFEAFRDGFRNTASVDVTLEPPGRIEGAAGSRYVEIPARITAIDRDGSRQVFTGTYTLRRSVVDGATPEQRAWRIYSAQVRRAGP